MDFVDIIIIIGFVATIGLLIFNLVKPSKEKKEKVDIDGKLSTLKIEMNASISEALRNMNSALMETLRLNHEQSNSQLKTVTENNEKVIKDLASKIDNLVESVDKKMEQIRNTTENKLNEMNKSMEEKLDKTLNERLQKSLEGVQNKLDAVTRGLVEMQSLATNVGDLKNVLTNVKTRGTFGEAQLGNILEDMLSKDQYVQNISTKKSGDVVEFAVKLPGKDKNDPVYIPIDSKFPLEPYYALQDAYESADKERVEQALKELRKAIEEQAKKIKDKYVNPPKTTEFAIMFLPTESLYAEVVRSGASEKIQKDHKIMITGPTTLCALLNSLSMGFRTLAIQEKSSEAWKVLEAVKTEFGEFAEVLESAQKRITQVNEELDKLIGTRTRKITQKLKSVSTMNLSDAQEIIGLPDPTDQDEN